MATLYSNIPMIYITSHDTSSTTNVDVYINRKLYNSYNMGSIYKNIYFSNKYYYRYSIIEFFGEYNYTHSISDKYEILIHKNKYEIVEEEYLKEN